MWGIITNDKRVQLGCFRLTFKGIYNLFLIVDTVVSLMFDHHSLQSLFFNDGANCSFSSLYKSACKSSWKDEKLLLPKQADRRQKGRRAKMIGATARLRAMLYSLTFCIWLSLCTLSALTISLISWAAVYRPGPSDSPNDLSTQSVSIIPPPHTLPFHLHTWIIHWLWQGSWAVDTSFHDNVASITPALASHYFIALWFCGDVPQDLWKASYIALPCIV